MQNDVCVCGGRRDFMIYRTISYHISSVGLVTLINLLFFRKRGKDPDTKAAVAACAKVGKDIIRLATGLCSGLDPHPRVDLEVGGCGRHKWT